VREAGRLFGVRKTTKEGGLPNARFTGDFHGNTGPNRAERLRQLLLTIEPPA